MRDTLAPFGISGQAKATTPTEQAALRSARAALPTLGEIEGSNPTATLRPPGAVPPPPRALPVPAPLLDSEGFERSSTPDTSLPTSPVRDEPFTALAGSALTLPSGGKSPPLDAPPTFGTATVVSAGGGGSAVNMKAPAAHTSSVPAPGLFIADAPLEPRPPPLSIAREQGELLTRMRVVVFVLGGLLLVAAFALSANLLGRRQARSERSVGSAASTTPVPPGCALLAPPSRISAIERSVPISVRTRPDGRLALAIADSKISAVGWVYDPISGEPQSKLDVPRGSGDVSHVSADEPPIVDRSSPDFAFAQTLAPGLAIGVGPSGLMRRGSDAGAGVIWSLAAGVRVTPPRAVSMPGGYFVAFRQGGAEGQISAGWLRPDGTAATDLKAVEAVPKSLGTPNVASLGEQALVLFSARADKSQPYRVYAATAVLGERVGAARVLELPSEGGGAIAPSLARLAPDRYLLQWTDGNVGQYQVHVRVFDAALQPLSQPLRVSAKGANAGQGTIVTTSHGAVSFFIQTTAGHDELWGVALSCH